MIDICAIVLGYIIAVIILFSTPSSAYDGSLFYALILLFIYVIWGAVAIFVNFIVIMMFRYNKSKLDENDKE
jgi:hypothetical protein